MSYIANDLIVQVQNKLGDTSFSAVDILQYLVNINRRIHNTYQLRYMQASQTYVTTLGNPLLGSLPDDFQTAYSLRRTDKQYAGKMEYMSFDEFDERYPQPTLTANSIPFVWYDFASDIYMFPAPSTPAPLTGYALELRYLKLPATFKATQTPDVPEEFQEALFLGAISMAMERRQRFDVSQLYTQQAEAVELALVQRYAIGQMAETDVSILATPRGQRV